MTRQSMRSSELKFYPITKAKRRKRKRESVKKHGRKLSVFDRFPRLGLGLKP